MKVISGRRKSVAAACLKGTRHHLYEDAYRMLPKDVPLVKELERGELFGVFDGIGSAAKGKEAAQAMADMLIKFYQHPDRYEASVNGVLKLLQEGNMVIHAWGFEEGKDVPLGGCAGTVVWIYDYELYVFHAGDTTAALIRDSQVTRLTREHQTENGAIFRYFGLGENLKIDVQHFDLDDFDRILIVSDGAVPKAFLTIEEAAGVLEEYDDIELGAKALVQRSRNRGSQDDITALLIEIEEEF